MTKQVTSPPSARLHRETSSRIAFLRFPLIVCIVFIHAHTGMFQWAAGAPGPAFSEDFISQALARIAVPLFFTISAFLFFWDLDVRAQFTTRLKRRFQTLLAPYLIWNLIALALDQFFDYVQKRPLSIAGYFAEPHGPEWFLRDTFWMPCANQLWFLRNLMFFFLLAPIFGTAAKSRVRVPILLLLIALWSVPSFKDWPQELSPGVGALEGILFFYIGALLAVAKVDLYRLERGGPVLAALALVSFGVFAAHLDPLSPYHEVSHPWVMYPVFAAAKIAAVPAIWWATGLACRASALKRWALLLGESSFFVFVAHGRLLGALISALGRILNSHGPGAALIAYLLLPVLLSLALVAIHRALKATWPGLANLLTGGR